MTITRRAVLVLIALALAAVMPRALAQELYKAAAGPCGVRIVDEEWRDAARDRAVPVRIFVPKPEGAAGQESKFPVIIFSHGLGGSRLNYRYLGEHLASHGYVVILPTHAGSDTAALLAWGTKPKNEAAKRDGWLKTSIADPDNLANRPKDISFVVDQLGINPLLKNVVDPSRVGVGGHSFGAYTSLCIAGMTVDLPAGQDTSFRDGRVRAVLPMSPQGSGTMGIDAGAWNAVAVPVLCLTGTKDYGEGARSAAWRREPFEQIRGVDDFLVTLTDAGHMTFSNAHGEGRKAPALPKESNGEGIRERLRGRAREKAREQAVEVTDEQHAGHIDLIRSVSAAFFDAYVKDDAAAKEWLRVFSMTKRSDCRVEFKPGR